MKEVQKVFAKINVLGCEEKIHHETKRQDMDKEGKMLFLVDVEEEVWNEKYSRMQSQIVSYKSLEDIKEGEHVVELKVTHMAEGSGNFIKVKSFYRIEKTIDPKVLLKDVFSLQGALTHTQKTKAKGASQSQQLIA